MQGSPIAQNRLARIYAFGRGGPAADPVQAIKWHLISKAGGNSDLQLDDYMQKQSPETRAAGEQAAKPWVDLLTPEPQRASDPPPWERERSPVLVADAGWRPRPRPCKQPRCCTPPSSTSWSPPPARPRAASSATSARSRSCRSRSRARPTSSPPPTTAPRRRCAPSSPGRGPGYGFLGEEGGRQEGADKTHCWIVDPLDGTTNFLHGIPQFAISIALEREGTIVAGVVYNPINEELFVAERGKGAFLNDQRLRVAARKRLSEAVIACGLPHLGRGDLAQFRQEFAAVQEKVAGLRRFGAAALDLAWVAAGRLDAYWERNLSPWDIAAGLILVREAGGFVSDLDGGEDMFDKREILAGNETMQRELLALIRQANRA